MFPIIIYNIWHKTVNVNESVFESSSIAGVDYLTYRYYFKYSNNVQFKDLPLVAEVADVIDFVLFSSILGLFALNRSSVLHLLPYTGSPRACWYVDIPKLRRQKKYWTMVSLQFLAIFKRPHPLGLNLDTLQAKTLHNENFNIEQS